MHRELHKKTFENKAGNVFFGLIEGLPWHEKLTCHKNQELIALQPEPVRLEHKFPKKIKPKQQDTHGVKKKQKGYSVGQKDEWSEKSALKRRGELSNRSRFID